jgi:hypothetical protein
MIIESKSQLTLCEENVLFHQDNQRVSFKIRHQVISDKNHDNCSRLILTSNHENLTHYCGRTTKSGRQQSFPRNLKSEFLTIIKAAAAARE